MLQVEQVVWAGMCDFTSEMQLSKGASIRVNGRGC